MTTAAEIPLIIKGTIGFIFGALALFLKRFISINDQKHKEHEAKIGNLCETINSLESKYQIQQKDIDALKEELAEIGGIGEELKKAFDIEQEIRQRDEMKVIRELAEAQKRDHKK